MTQRHGRDRNVLCYDFPRQVAFPSPPFPRPDASVAALVAVDLSPTVTASIISAARPCCRYVASPRDGIITVMGHVIGSGRNAVGAVASVSRRVETRDVPTAAASGCGILLTRHTHTHAWAASAHFFNLFFLLCLKRQNKLTRTFYFLDRPASKVLIFVISRTLLANKLFNKL